MTTVAITRTDSIDATTAPVVALTEGFQAAFLACTVIAAIGILAALTTLGSFKTGTAPDQTEAAPAAH